MTKRKFYIFIILIQFVATGYLLSQSRPYEGPDDPAADIGAIRAGYMTGNRVRLKFSNSTEFGDWPEVAASKWPDDHTGQTMIDRLGVLIGAKVYIANDSIPVTDPQEIANRTDLDTLYFCQTKYRSPMMDENPAGTVQWGLYPVFGYFNENSETPAISNRTNSWPVEGWPSTGNQLKWPGEWNGRFGRGVQYADLESFFVANDAHDQEYLQTSSSIKYYPRPGVKIGDKRPDVTIQAGMPWGGIGVRVEVRGFQWNNLQCRDALFWEYNIANISDYDLPEVAFGYFIDNGFGGSVDVIGFYDKLVDMAYSWDLDGVGKGGLTPGVMGIAYLESPGILDDNIDNDDDGLTDEKRDNKAENLVGPYDGITDLGKFLAYYNRTEESLKEHWDADEDQDWTDGIDLNENGIYDFGEFAGDDVGLDGVGPSDLNYFGPDADGTECNHKPDFQDGVGSEPNFGPTDISESDMVGLTAFEMFYHPQSDPPSPRHDKAAWELIAGNQLIEYYGDPSNLIEMFGSGPFPLLQGRTERISIAEIHAYEDLAGLNSPEHSAPSLFKKKSVVQGIYEGDYRFVQPPIMPTLKATPGDGKVILTWDDLADKFSREPLLKGMNDFEGYKLYKSTDKFFADAEKLVDGFGNPIAKKPIFQCDLKDGITGFTNFATINGEGFYLGDDSGIQHYYVDENVENGRTYYYAITAYDFGIPEFAEGAGAAPSENNIVIDLDEDENIQFVGKNVQVVTPHQQAAGYTSADMISDKDSLIVGNGIVQSQIFDIKSVKDNNSYKIKFHVDTLDYQVSVSRNRHARDLLYCNSGFDIYDITDGDSIIYSESAKSYAGDNLLLLENKYGSELVHQKRYNWFLNYEKDIISEVIDGIQVKMQINSGTADYAPEKSGWIVGNSSMQVTPVTFDDFYYFPWQYEIIFTDNDSTSVTRVSKTTSITDINGERIGGDGLIGAFNFYVINRSFPDSTGECERLDLVIHDVNQNGVFDIATDYIIAGNTVSQGSRFKWSATVFVIDFHNVTDSTKMPKPNDAYVLDFHRPFLDTDEITFKFKPAVELSEDKLKNDMDDIKVVPNPYVATNAMEPAVSNHFLNQRRRLIFTHIPAQCTITIFTPSGVLVDEIHVDNPSENGLVHWDLLTRENLEIAAGIYIYHVKAKESGVEKIGKFAVIK